GAVDDPGQQDERRVAVELVLPDEGVERALLAVVAQLDALDVEGDGAFELGDLHHPLGRHEQELGLRVDELPDQPRPGHPVPPHLPARDPLHRFPLGANVASDYRPVTRTGPKRPCPKTPEGDPETPSAPASAGRAGGPSAGRPRPRVLHRVRRPSGTASY